MNGGEVVVRTLRERGLERVFFVAGGTFITVMEALSRDNAIRGIPMRLESSATFAAEAYAALARRPAAVFVTRAPGAANAVIGVHTAMQASRPMVLFVANIPGPLKQRETFQEVDYNQMYGPVAKAVFEVHSFNELAAVTARACDLSVNGRPGPVVVAVGRDILDGPTGEPASPPAPTPVIQGLDAGTAGEIAAAMAAARRPVVLAGEMVAYEGAHAELAALAEASGAGVLAAYRQQDVIDNLHPAYFGHLTLNRLAHVERALDECDLLVCIGTRLDSVTTQDYAFQRDGQDLAVIYPDPAVMAQWPARFAAAASARNALSALAAAVSSPPSDERLAWRDGVHAEEAAFADAAGTSVHGQVNLAEVISHFREVTPEDSILVSDAGTFGRWLHRYYPFTRPDTALGPVSGAMGYGVPGGVGAQVARPDTPVFVWVGDGGFLMTGHDAVVMVQEQLPVRIIVCDNAAWGSIMVSAQNRFPGMEYGTKLNSPDFAQLAIGYGMAAFKVVRTGEFPDALARAMAEPGPALIHIQLDARDVSPYAAGPKAAD
ncbi:MAG: thiamine pyrophosphate-dependent enzyme [Pseudomonadota bacterium]